TVNYGKENIDSDPAQDATGLESDQWLAAIGGDVTLGDYGVLGIGAGYIKNDADMDWYDGSIDSDGWQIGAYGAYDPGQFYIRASVSYSDLNGKSTRNIAVGSAFGGTATADVDSSIWSVGGEVGYRLQMGSAVLTPYGGLDYVSVDMDGFTESGVSGANLTVNDSKDEY